MTKNNTAFIKDKALEIGFSSCGISKARHLSEEQDKFEMWLSKGYQGSMSYLYKNIDKRLDPRILVPGAKSVISLTYNYFPPKKLISAKKTIIKYNELINKYKIKSIEDPFAENDWNSWNKFNNIINNKIQVVGDDIFVTNLERLKVGFLNNSANSILIKLNQIGTVTETLEVIKFAQLIGFNTIISHRSGDSEDTFISDFAVGTNSNQIKTGSLSRSERVAKYNQLLRIEEQLGKSAKMNKIH